ncbi:MAG: hypothetical protein J2P23_07830 [Microlunatus sp.]|nr:hypothetical protein [Microlunatus sp.]
MADTSASAPASRSTFVRGMIFSLLLTVIFDIGLAIGAFEFSRRVLGVGDFGSYLIASIGPLVGMAIGLIRTKKLGGMSLIILAQILISALVTLIGAHDARTLLLKDSVLTGAFGAVVLITSIRIFPKPLMFFFGLKFGTDGTADGVAEWYRLWDKYAQFRGTQYLINNVWGIGFLGEALIKAIGVYVLPYEAAYAVNQVAPFILLAGLIAWTMSYAAKARKRGEARAAAAAALEQNPG